MTDIAESTLKDSGLSVRLLHTLQMHGLATVADVRATGLLGLLRIDGIEPPEIEELRLLDILTPDAE